MAGKGFHFGFPLSLTNWPLFATKAGGAAGLAMALTQGLHVRDAIAASFLAFTSTSPTASAGVRNGVNQFLASALGGAISATLLSVGLQGPWAMALSVGGTLLAVGLTRRERAYPVAVFTSVYLVAVAKNEPFTSLAVRLESLALGATAALVVNVVVSVLWYRHLFERRLAICEEALNLAVAAEKGPARDDAFLKAQTFIAQVRRELGDAEKDHLFYGATTKDALQQSRQRLDSLNERAQSLVRNQ